MVTCGGDQCAWLRASLMEDLVRVRRATCSTHSYPTLNHWRARSGVDPPRPIPNRVVKHSSAEGTARLPCGRLGLCANTYIPRRGAVAARWAHNPKVSGSNPLAATNFPFSEEILRRGFLYSSAKSCRKYCLGFARKSRARRMCSVSR